MSEVVTAVHVRGGLDRVGVGGSHIGTGDLVPVAMDDPPKGRESGPDGERRILLGEVAGGARERFGIARRPIRRAESARRVTPSNRSAHAEAISIEPHSSPQ